MRWMRERIGVVEQEPVLFDLSILENIRLVRVIGLSRLSQLRSITLTVKLCSK